MKLLTFAHRAEAQAFITHFNFSTEEFFFNGFLKAESYYLLLTDEGPQSASERTVAVLSAFKNDIDEVLNIGIAGSLSPQLKKHQTFWVRTSYAHHAEKLEFKSYTSTGNHSSIDCLTAYNRVLTSSERDKLSCFASSVDRELWAIASAASLFKLPFASLKIISDDFQSTEDKKEICQIIKEDAHFFSESLLQAFIQRYHQKSSPTLRGAVLPILEDEAFYFTTTQERKLKSLVEGLKLKQIPIPGDFVEDLRMQSLLPKERSRLLLIELNDLLNPFAKKMRRAIEKAVQPLTQAGLSVHYNPSFEQSLLHLTININSERDIEKAKNALKIFSYADYKKIFDGEIDDV